MASSPTPGAPLAQSTPNVPNNNKSTSSSSSRSAFAVLQPAAMIHHHPYGPPPSAGYYFPGAEPMFHHPATAAAYPPFMHWPRPGAGHWATAYPGHGFMMPMGAKMEPYQGFGMKEEQKHMTTLMKMEAGGGGRGGGQKRKAPTTKGGGRGKKTAKKQPNDSGLGDDSVIDNVEERKKNNNSTASLLLLDNSASSTPQPDDTFASVTLNDTTNTINGMIALPPPMLHPINDYETYCTVPGRLTLLSNLKKYRVSIAEIRRRIEPPECLNASILGGILRKAKNKDGGRLLREQLNTYGVELTSGRRKQGPLTCFSALVEEEAAQIASDFNVLNQKSYPSKEAATYAMNEIQNAQDASLCRMELYYASKFLNRILDFHRADQTPVANMPALKEDPTLTELGPEIQRALTNYSLLTHGFGGRVVQSVLETMQSVINESNNLLNFNHHQQPHQQQQQAGTSSSSIDDTQVDGPITFNGAIPMGYK